MDINVDSKGVVAAVSYLSALESKGVISLKGVKEICCAVIGRYDQSEESAELAVDAQFLLDHYACSIWLGNIERLARSLIKAAVSDEA